MGDAARPASAIILAAGMGTRLRSAVPDSPKGLLTIGGETLVGRSVRLLQQAGIESITIVAGYASEHYLHFAAAASARIQVFINDAFATTGSMASLAVALDFVRGPALVLESDIVYESRALTTLVDNEASNATLMSGPTGAGDEVWVSAPRGLLHSMSKRREDLQSIDGEFVGITRLDASALAAMREAFQRFTRTHGHGRMDYESDALVEVARTTPVHATLIDDLLWGEIDDERHLKRVIETLLPRLKAATC